MATTWEKDLAEDKDYVQRRIKSMQDNMDRFLERYIYLKYIEI